MNTSSSDNARPHYKNSILSEEDEVRIVYRRIIVIKDFIFFGKRVA
jgi:hypothetical protein